MENLWKLNKISENCARGAALATGTEVEWQQRYPDYGEIYWNEYMDQIMKDIFEHVGRTCEDSPGPGGSSDIGNVNLKIPVFHPLLDITGKDKTCVVHDRRFERILHTTEMQKALYDGGKILYELGYLLATNEEKLKSIKEMHKKYRKLV